MIAHQTPFKMTVKNPRNQNVGDGPIGNIIRNIIHVTKARIPDGRGTNIRTGKCKFDSEIGNKYTITFYFFHCLICEMIFR